MGADPTTGSEGPIVVQLSITGMLYAHIADEINVERFNGPQLAADPAAHMGVFWNVH